jgi:hypothetical protein
MPLFIAKTPCAQCTLTAATIITDTINPPATGVRNPAASSRPPATSAAEAAAANNRPGLNPRASKKPAVPVSP